MAAAIVLLPLAEPITVHFRAMSTTELCRRLSELPGASRMEVAEPLAGQIVLLDAERVSLDLIRQKLADSLKGAWTPTKDGYRLSRPPELKKALEKADLDSRITQTERLFAREKATVDTSRSAFQRAEEILTQIKNHPEAIRRWVAAGTVGIQPVPVTHGDVLLTQLVTSLDARSLAALADGEKVDWSDHPTPSERPLPPSAAKWLEQFKETEAQIAALVDDEGRIGDMESKDDYLVKSYQLGTLKPTRLPGGIAKTILSGYRLGRAGYTFQVCVFNPDGQARARVGKSFFFDPSLFNRRGLPASHVAASEPFRGQKAPLSEMSRQLLAASVHSDWLRDFSRRLPFDPVEKPTKELLDVVCQPETNDPLALAVTDAVLGLGKSARRNVIAVLPDTLQRTISGSTRAGEVLLDSFVDVAAGTGVVTLDLTDDWLSIRPVEPLIAEANRISRPLLGRHLRQVRSAGFETLREVAKYHWNAGLPARTSPVAQSCRTVLIESGVTPIFSNGLALEEMLALLGSIGDSAWQQLESGQPLDVGALSGKQRSLLYDLAFFQPVPQPGSPVSDMMRQRTVARPNGPVPGIELSMKIDRAPAIVRASPQSEDSLLDTLLETEALQSQVGSSILGGDAKNVAEVLIGMFYYGTYKRTSLRIQFAPGFLITATWMAEPSVDRSRDPVSYQDLPESFRTDLEARVADFLKKAGR